MQKFTQGYDWEVLELERSGIHGPWRHVDGVLKGSAARVSLYFGCIQICSCSHWSLATRNHTSQARRGSVAWHLPPSERWSHVWSLILPASSPDSCNVILQLT